MRPCIGSAHEHPVRVRADVIAVRLPPSVVRHPCRGIMMAVQPVKFVSGQNPLLRGPGVPRERAHGELALDDGPGGFRVQSLL